MASENKDLGLNLTTAGIEIKLKSFNVCKPGWCGGGESIATQSSNRPDM